MFANKNSITNNKSRNKNRKHVFLFSKDNPGKVKRILFLGTSQTKFNQTFKNKYELENVFEIDLKPRAVVTVPTFQSIKIKDTFKRNYIRINSGNRKASSQSSLKATRNSNHYFKYIYHNNGLFKANYKVYRCQISSNQEACCCSCNSDAMFEVMKSLYDCYKKKNCDNCNCILCGHWPRGEKGPPEKAKIEIEAAGEKKKEKKKKISKESFEEVESKVKPKKEKGEAEVPKTEPEAKGLEKGLAPKVKSARLSTVETAVSTDKIKEKAPDLLKILETTPPEQKEKILKEAVMKGTAVPEAKTASEKKMIDKIQKDVGLPPKPKSSTEKAKYENALEKGLITPLEGKTAAQKEKILRGQANLGLKLPEGRTPSEKALIAQVQSEAKATKKIKQLEKKTAKSMKESKGPSDECICGLMTPIADKSAEKIVSPDKIKKDKELGTLSPLKGKTKSQKEKVLRGMALQGNALPEGKTTSENELLDNVRKSLGLPPTPKSPQSKQKYKAATDAGVIVPLEGKTAKQKEKILREQAALGIPLPEGRTPSEKAMVSKIKAIAPPLSDVPVSSKILKKAKDTGLLTPIKGKTRDEKEKILTGLAMHGLPLPEVRTASEKKIVDKIHADLGLPPPPVSSAAKEKYQKAFADGLIVPLEGKTAAQKEKILQNQANMGLALPVGRTPSEKLLVEKVKGKAKEIAPIQQLKGKPPEQKEKILRGLAMNGILLPEAKSPSEKKIIDKVRDDLGLPPEPKSESEKRAYKQSIATGDIAPLEGKSPMQKEKILRNVAKMGLKLPSGRTPSEKALVAKVLAAESTMPLIKPPSAEMEKKVKSKLLMKRLEGKPPEHKEKILKELAIRGTPLPEPRTASEKKLIDKVRKEVPFPAPQAAIGLPEGQLVAPEISQVRLPSHVEKKAKAAGLLTPLKGKKKEQRENILKGLAMNGIPLPEGKTPSERKVIEKVQKQLGLPPVPESPSEKKKYTKAIISGQVAPLEGKTASQKEDIIKNQLRLGLNVPVGRTPSEKAIIDKVIQSEVRVPSQILKKAKDAGLLTPLKGKKKEQKESILKGLAMNGIPLPEAKTPSENKIIEKVREDLGLPPEPESPTEKAQYKKAIISGQIAPLEGKSASQKEDILKNQVKMGLKLPKGRTSSEKSLINKVKKGAPVKKPAVVSPEKLKKAIDTSMIIPLEGKTKEEKEKFLKDLALRSIPLPEAKTASDKKILQKVQADVGLPPPPKTSHEKEQYKKALAQGYIAPLEGKTMEQKEQLLRNQAAMGLALPKGRTSSEKALIAKVKNTAQLEKKSAKAMKEAKGPSDECICSIVTPGALAEMPLKEIKSLPEVRVPSQVLKKAKAAGLLTPLKGKKKEQKESILKGLAMNGIPLPEAKTASEQKIIEKVREDLGLPPEPESPAEKEKYNKAIITGQIAPLEGKTASQKEDIIRNQAKMGFSLPKGRTSSEKSLISKIKKQAEVRLPSQVFKKAKEAGLLTPLEGKKKEQKEKILKGLAMNNIPLPEAKTPSENKIMEKVRADLGLPPPPESFEEKQKYNKAVIAGQIAPLEGKSASQKEDIIKNHIKMGFGLPEGRTASEKAIIDKVMAAELRVPSQVLKKAKAAGLLTPIKGKKKEQKEAILKGLAMNGIPLPEAKSPSENKIIEKVRMDLGLPPEPVSATDKLKYKKAIISGDIAPLEGKTASQKENILKNQMKLGLSLPKGRTSSEKSLIDKVKKQIKPAELPPPLPESKSLMVPLEGKSKEEKEKFLKDLALRGIPLPEAKTASDKKIVRKVQTAVGLPPPPKTAYQKEQYKKALAQGYIAPLEGKTAEQKEKLLRNQAALGLTLPKGRTSSEKALIAKVKNTTPKVPKSREQLEKLEKKSAKAMKEAKGPSDECICSIISTEIQTEKPLIPEAKIQPEIRVPSEVLKKAKDAGLLTPLKGKKKEQKESILKGLAMNNIPLPEATSPSESKIIKKVREDLGLPPAPESPSEKEKYNKAIIAGKIAPLEGKSTAQKEDIIRNQMKMGLSLPKGRTSSEKSLIDKIKKQPEAALPSHILKKAKAAGLLTPLQGKKKEQKEKILKGLAMNNIPLPEAKTPSENKIIEKVREDLGLPPAPESPSEKEKYNKAIIAGKIAPLEGKSKAQKEDIIRNQMKMGLSLPKGRTSSEKSLIDNIKKQPEAALPSQILKKAKAAGLLTPLQGKKKEQKEKILKGLAMNNIPLPEAKTASENKIIEKVREDLGLPPAPVSPAEKEKYNKAIITGQIAPLEGKTRPQKEEIIKNQVKLGLNLPQGRTSSEKSLIAKAKKHPEIFVPAAERAAIEKVASEVRVPSQVMKKAKDAGLLTPLKGKKKKQKEAILKGLAMNNIPLPEAKTPSENKIIAKVREDLGLPPPPKTPAEKDKYNKAIITGQIAPLEGKTRSQKEDIIKNQINMGLNLPKGRTSSEKSLIAKIKKQPDVFGKVKKPPEVTGKVKKPAEVTLPSEVPKGPEKSIIDRATSEVRVPSETMKKAKAAGLLTPLKGKKKKQKEKILRGLAMNGIPLPEAKTSSENKLMEKIRTDLGLPPEPESPAEKVKYKKAIIAGKIGPLEGKTPSQKEDIIRNQLKMGLVLPKGRTSSEKSLIDKVKVESEIRLPSKQLKKAKAAGLLTPLEGKKKEQKESILKGLAMNNIPLPEAKSPSESKIIEKVRADIGLPPAPVSPDDKEKYNKAIISGQIAPLEGKTASQKENIIRNQLKLGLNVPKGRTASERSLIDKVKKTSPKVSKTAVSPVKSKKALDAGLIESLEGKTKAKKEKILKDLAKREIPLPEAKTASDKKIIEKVQADMGLPPQPKTSLEKKQYEKAVAKGYITPLEGKTSEQKEKILRKQAAMGIKLPKGRTPSEKALIAKIKTTLPKTPKELEKIEKLEKKTAKSMKESKGPVDECICDVVSSVVGKSKEDVLKPTSVMSEQIKKAEAAGHFKPLEGKKAHEKEKILKDLAMQGIALPKAKNKSEKKVLDKVRLELGLPSEPTSDEEKQRYDKALTKGLLVPLEGKSKSQKEKLLRNQAALGINLPKGRTPSEISMIEKIKTSTKKASKISVIRGSVKELVAKPRKAVTGEKPGISESIQEVTKTTTCDKGCGCDTKKIKFKHSYVKIRITSPDMSSICPCPEECFPGVQGGVFTDNEGIKVTVGRVMEITGFLQNNQEKKFKPCSLMAVNTMNTFYSKSNIVPKITKSESFLATDRKNGCTLCASHKNIFDLNTMIKVSDDVISNTLQNENSTTSSSLSSGMFEIDSNLSFATPNSDSNKSLDILHQCHLFFKNGVVDENINKPRSEVYLERSSCDSTDTHSSIYLMDAKKSSSIYYNSEALVQNLSQNLYALKSTRSDFQKAHESYDQNCDSAYFEQNVKENEIENILKQIVAKELLSQTSSFIIIVPTSSEEVSDYYYPSRCSSMCIQVSKNCCYRNTPRNKLKGPTKKIEFKFSNEDVSLHPCSLGATQNLTRMDSAQQTCIQDRKKSHVISTDTTQDRPCCCDHTIPQGRSDDSCSTPPNPCLDKSSSSDKSCSQLMDILKKTMSIACGTGEDISKFVKRKNKPKIKEQRNDLPCGCCSSSIELSHYEICVDMDDTKSKNKNSPCCCSSKNKSNVICQCPDESQEVDYDKYLKQVQSDLTQCTSGFKLKIAPQASFEDVLRYYARQVQSKTDCACSKRSKKNCECPAQKKVEPFKGFKIHMDGKGSASKALNGFLCFELLDCVTPYQDYRIDSNSMLVTSSSNQES